MTRQQGLTNKESVYDIERAFDAGKKTVMKYEWDMAPLPSFLYPGTVMEYLQIKQYKWPGYNLPDHLPF